MFNNPDSVSAETRKRVLKAAEELDYHPNLIASNFVRGISGNIGVIIPHIPNVHIFSVYYFSELLSGIGEALEEKGYDLMLFFHPIQEEGENDYSRYFKSGKVDGCILLGTRRNDWGLLRLQESGARFCLVNNYIEGSGISYIDVNNTLGSYQAVRHLIDLGHRRIVFLNGPEAFTNSIDRLNGYRKALEEHDIPFREEFVLYGNYGKKSGYMAAEPILKMDGKPTAVFAGNDRMAAGVIQGLRDQGISVPGDLAVIGYDDSDTARIIDPPLTTVRIPFFELGRRTVHEFVKSVQDGKSEGFHVLIEPELIVRESSGMRHGG